MQAVHAFNTKVESVLGRDKIGYFRQHAEKRPFIPLFYGVEFEFEVHTPSYTAKEDMQSMRNLASQKIQDALISQGNYFAFVKHDGSLKNGFEVVSKPMSMEAHKTYWDKFFTKAKDAGLLVRTTCGMHVHVSKEILTQFQIGKMLVFLFSPANSQFMLTMAGRKPPVINGKEYAEMKPKRLGDCRRHKERYSALNLTNPQTVEFRMFKGTASKAIALKNIEFCDAMVHFTWPAQVGYSQLRQNGVKAFCEFVHKNYKDYPHLFEFLVAKNYIKVKAKKKARAKKGTTKKKEKGSSLIQFLERYQKYGNDNETYCEYADEYDD